MTEKGIESLIAGLESRDRSSVDAVFLPYTLTIAEKGGASCVCAHEKEEKEQEEREVRGAGR